MNSTRAALPLALAALAANSSAQCPSWTDDLELAGIFGVVHCAAS